MVRSALAVVAWAAGCGGTTSEPPTSSRDVFTGTLVVDGRPVALTGCRPGRSVHTFVEVVTAVGTLRFEDQRLYWNPVPDAITRGDLLTCSKLDRSWGGGNRGDGTSYWRGTLAFTCSGYSGDLVLDCGDITATERAQLDANRKQASSRDAAGR